MGCQASAAVLDWQGVEAEWVVSDQCVEDSLAFPWGMLGSTGMRNRPCWVCLGTARFCCWMPPAAATLLSVADLPIAVAWLDCSAGPFWLCICQRHRSGAGCSELTSLSMLTRSHTFPTHGLQLPSRACTWAVPPLCLSTRLPQLSQRASRGLGLQTTEAAGPNKSQGETFYRLQDLWCVSPPVPALRASLPLAPTCVAGRVNPEPARRPRCSQGDKALLLSGFVCFRRPLWVKADILVQLCPIRVSADLDARGEQLGQ
jgi:hypothetical protein